MKKNSLLNTTSEFEVNSSSNNQSLESDVIKLISDQLIFNSSLLNEKLVEFNVLEIVKEKVAIDILNEYQNNLKLYSVAINNSSCIANESIKYEIDSRHGWNIFSSHFWETRGKKAWAIGVYALSFFYTAIAHSSQIIVAVGHFVNKNWLEFSDALASMQFEYNLLRWITDAIYSATKGISEWKSNTNCTDLFQFTRKIVV